VNYDRHTARNLKYHVRLINCEEHFKVSSTHCAVHNICLLWGTFITHNGTLCRLLAASMSGWFVCLHYEAGTRVHLVIPCLCNFILFSESWGGVGERIQINRQKPRIWVCKSHMAGQPCHTLLRLTHGARSSKHRPTAPAGNDTNTLGRAFELIFWLFLFERHKSQINWMLSNYVSVNCCSPWGSDPQTSISARVK